MRFKQQAHGKVFVLGVGVGVGVGVGEGEGMYVNNANTTGKVNITCKWRYERPVQENIVFSPTALEAMATKKEELGEL